MPASPWHTASRRNIVFAAILTIVFVYVTIGRDTVPSDCGIAPVSNQPVALSHAVSQETESEYRRFLSTVHPLDQVPHSQTLGIASKIYVIGLPSRTDRRDNMEALAKAMGQLKHFSMHHRFVLTFPC